MRKLIATLIGFLLLVLSMPSASAETKLRPTGKGYVQSLGWVSSTSNGIIGTTGRSLRLEAVTLDPAPIRYQVYIRGKGWSNWINALDNENEYAGIIGKGATIEGVRMVLDDYWVRGGAKLYVRAHMQDYGWLDYVDSTSNPGVYAGKIGKNKRLEAIKIKVTFP